MASGDTATEVCRLDDLWVLECSFTNAFSTNEGLASVKLTEELREVWVEPPPSYTGAWTTYYAKGQPCHQGRYKNGHPDGEGLGYYANGSKRTVMHWANEKPDGEETSYYPSGRIRYTGSYKAGAKVGTWIAWAARFRRLARDYERLAETLAGYHWLAFAMLMLSCLFRKS